jgi:hypothetical protein
MCVRFGKLHSPRGTGSGELQRSMNDHARVSAFADGWRSEKARNHARRCRLERTGAMAPGDVATILPAQHAIEHDVVQTVPEELDLPQ